MSDPWVTRQDLRHPLVGITVVLIAVFLFIAALNVAMTGDWDGHPGETCRQDTAQGAGYDCEPNTQTRGDD